MLILKRIFLTSDGFSFLLSNRLLHKSCIQQVAEQKKKQVESAPLPYEQVPGPSKLKLPLMFLPGGALHNVNLIDMHKVLRERYGDIVIFKGYFGEKDTVITYNPEDFEKVYRTEGIWPERIGLISFDHYRKKVRPDFFQGLGGLVSDQGKQWADFRNKVNPVLMRPENIRKNIPRIEKIATEFVRNLSAIIDPVTGESNANFNQEIKKWSVEQIGVLALNKRLGLLDASKENKEALEFIQCMNDFFEISYDIEMKPPIWKYYESGNFKKLMKIFDTITDFTTKHIEEGLANVDPNAEAVSILEKLNKIDRKTAIIMANDMLMAGVDTTSSAFVTTLYHLATNAEKQEKLRKEVFDVSPDRFTELTVDNLRNLPYLRACIKEALRITPITPANFRMSGQDLVLSGYKIPKGTGVLMCVMKTSNTDTYFPQSSLFIPERWLKNREDACPHMKANHPFVYLPFGFGPRTCIGKRIAEMEIECLLIKLLRNYKVSWHSTEPIRYRSNLVLVPEDNLKFKFETI